MLNRTALEVESGCSAVVLDSFFYTELSRHKSDSSNEAIARLLAPWNGVDLLAQEQQVHAEHAQDRHAWHADDASPYARLAKGLGKRKAADTYDELCNRDTCQHQFQAVHTHVRTTHLT